MALHDNPLWILSHIRNSFIVSDNTANSQMILTNDYKPFLADLAKKEGLDVKHEKCINPFADNSDNSDDELSKSVEIRPGNRLRPRCDTERKLEKLKHDRSKQLAPVRTISWYDSDLGGTATDQDVDDLFPKKSRSVKTVTTPNAKRPLESSLLALKIETSPQPIENPFADFSRFDAANKAPKESMTIRVLLTALNSNKEYIEGRVHPQTLVSDVIGFMCWKYVHENRQPPLKSINVDSYSMYMADPDGSIDWELRPLSKSDPISRFGFTDYALVNVEDETSYSGKLDVKVTLPDGTYTVVKLPSKDITAQALVDKALSRHKIKPKIDGICHNFFLEAKSQMDKPMDPNQSLHTVEDTEFFIVRENSRRCTEFEPGDSGSGQTGEGTGGASSGAAHLLAFYAMDPSIYQEFRDVYHLTKIPIRSRMGVVLAISQDRFDILPHQTPSGRIWTSKNSIPKEGIFNMESIAACEITEKPEDADQLWTFRLVLEHKTSSYKKVYFQASKSTVEEVHAKMTSLLQWHSSQARTNYISYKELKSHRRKTNLF